MLQGISLKKKVREKKREKRKARGDQASSSEAHCFYFQNGLLYLYLYIEGNERCKVIQSQPKHYIYFLIYNILSLFLSLSHLPRPLFLQVPLDPAGAGPWQLWQFYFQFFKESPHCSPQWLY